MLHEAKYVVDCGLPLHQSQTINWLTLIQSILKRSGKQSSSLSDFRLGGGRGGGLIYVYIDTLSYIFFFPLFFSCLLFVVIGSQHTT